MRFLRRDIERRRATGIEGLELARHNIRQWVKSGVVKSLKSEAPKTMMFAKPANK